MTLRQARVKFSYLIAKLILQMSKEGYEAALDEGTERITKKDPSSDHMKGSLHHMGLAQDINLYLNGIWLSTTEDHTRFGEWWEEQDPNCRWGGRFGDGNHYSYAPPELVGKRA